MGVQWDSRSIEFKLLYLRYNKNINYKVNNSYVHNSFLGTIAIAAANAKVVDKIIERINTLQKQQNNITDILLYGYKEKQAKVVDTTAAKLEFLKHIRTKQFNANTAV